MLTTGSPQVVSTGEMLFILVLFPIAPYKDFQHVWRYGLRHEDRDCFAELPNGSRFVSLPPRPLLPCSLLLHSFRGPTTGIHVADSTKLAICHNGRISRNRIL